MFLVANQESQSNSLTCSLSVLLLYFERCVSGNSSVWLKKGCIGQIIIYCCTEKSYSILHYLLFNFFIVKKKC